MAQLIYAVLALALVMILSMNVQRGTGQTQRDQALNEITTLMTGVGTEVLDRVGSGHFDLYNAARTSDTTSVFLCGRLTELQKDRLRPYSEFGTDDVHCPDYENCSYIEGYHGLTHTVSRDGFDYDVTIRVRYYNDEAPADTTTPSFAKEVIVTIGNPYLYLGDDPTETLDVTMSRVFTYDWVTNPAYIPYAPVPHSPCSS